MKKGGKREDKGKIKNERFYILKHITIELNP
jgi:hypothetical protein